MDFCRDICKGNSMHIHRYQVKIKIYRYPGLHFVCFLIPNSPSSIDSHVLKLECLEFLELSENCQLYIFDQYQNSMMQGIMFPIAFHCVPVKCQQGDKNSSVNKGQAVNVFHYVYFLSFLFLLLEPAKYRN